MAAAEMAAAELVAEIAAADTATAENAAAEMAAMERWWRRRGCGGGLETGGAGVGMDERAQDQRATPKRVRRWAGTSVLATCFVGIFACHKGCTCGVRTFSFASRPFTLNSKVGFDCVAT